MAAQVRRPPGRPSEPVLASACVRVAGGSLIGSVGSFPVEGRRHFSVCRPQGLHVFPFVSSSPSLCPVFPRPHPPLVLWVISPSAAWKPCLPPEDRRVWGSVLTQPFAHGLILRTLSGVWGAAGCEARSSLPRGRITGGRGLLRSLGSQSGLRPRPRPRGTRLEAGRALRQPAPGCDCHQDGTVRAPAAFTSKGKSC